MSTETETGADNSQNDNPSSLPVETSPSNEPESTTSTETTTSKSDLVPSKTFRSVKKTTIDAIKLLATKMNLKENQVLDNAIESLLSTPKQDSHKFDPSCTGCQDELLQRGYVLVDGPTWEKVRHHV